MELFALFSLVPLALMGCKGGVQSKQKDFVASDSSGNKHVMVKISVTETSYAGTSNISESEKQKNLEYIRELKKPTCYYKAGPFTPHELTPYNPGFVMRSGSKVQTLTPQYVNADAVVEHLKFWGGTKLAATGAGAFGLAALSVAAAPYCPLVLALCIGTASTGAIALGTAAEAAGGQFGAGSAIEADQSYKETNVDYVTFGNIAEGIKDYVNTKPNARTFACPAPEMVAAAAEVQSGNDKTVSLSQTKLANSDNAKKLVLCIKKTSGILAEDAKLDAEGCMKKYAPVSGSETILDCKVNDLHLCVLQTDTASPSFSSAFEACTKKSCKTRG